MNAHKFAWKIRDARGKRDPTKTPKYKTSTVIKMPIILSPSDGKYTGRVGTTYHLAADREYVLGSNWP